MALRAGYKGIKKLAAGLKWNRPGILAADDIALAKVFFPRSEQAVLGAENLLLNQVNAGTVSDIVVSSVDNDKIKLAGTANNANNVVYSNQKVGAGVYRLSAVYTGTTSDDQRPSVIADLYNANGTVKTSNYVIVRPSSTSANITVSGTDYLSNFRVYFANGDVIDMEIAIDLKLATDPSTEHVKGSMTNQELTASAVDQKNTINAIITAATGAADFAAFKTAMGAITLVTRSAKTVEPEEIVKEEITAEPVVEKKTTRKKSTAKAETQEEV